MKWAFRFAFLLCAVGCFAQNTVSVTVDGKTYTGTLTAQASAAVPVPTAAPQLPRVFMGGTAWALNRPANTLPVETRAFANGTPTPTPIKETFYSVFGPNHIRFDTSMRITTVDTRQTPAIFAPVTITTTWGSDDQVVTTDPVTKVQTITVPHLPVIGCKIEGGNAAPADSDRHCLIYDSATGILHELFGVQTPDGKSYSALAYRKWPGGVAQVGRPGQNSADAAGLPILPLLLRYSEAASGSINHALRFTMNLTRNNANGGVFTPPASHAAGQNWGVTTVMGQRFYLRPDFPTTGLSPINVTIVNCLKTYGLVLADNGMSGLVTADNDARWNQDDLHTLAVALTLNDVIPVNSGSLLDATGAQVQ